MFTRQLRVVACIVALCMGAGPLPAEDKGHSLVRFVCQQQSIVTSHKLLDTVVIAEQLSVEEFDGDEIIDVADLIDPDGKVYTKRVPFRMRIYNDVSLVHSERSKEEVIDDLLQRSASRDIDGDLMDFTGKGGRFMSEFAFSSITPYAYKALFVDLDGTSNGSMSTNNGAFTMHEDGPYRCEPPTLIRQ